MRWEWSQFNLWGMAMRVPMLRLIIRKVEEQRTEFKKYSAEMEACPMCHKLTSHHRGVRMIIHLKIEHGFNEDRAIAIVEDLWREVFILKPRRENTEI